jgi:hypothetical protein
MGSTTTLTKVDLSGTSLPVVIEGRPELLRLLKPLLKPTIAIAECEFQDQAGTPFAALFSTHPLQP